jgi:hypothetical protein
MVHQLITRQQFETASRRVRLWECLVGVPAICAAGILLIVVLFGTVTVGFGPDIRAYVGDSGGMAPAIFGIVISIVVFGTLCPVAFLSAHWVDHKLGLRCPKCGRSITSIWIHRAPTPGGECRSCKYQLFDGASENASGE